MKTPYTIPASIEKRLQTWIEWAQRQGKQDKVLKPCITISREFGCQAYPLAVILHEKLSKLSEGKEEWAILDRLLLEKIAKESGYSTLELEYITKVNPNIEDMISPIMGKKHAETLKAFTYIRKTVRFFAKVGNCIIVGRGGVCLTQDLLNVLHIRLVAPFSFKVNIIMRTLNIKQNEARQYIETKQGERDNFIRHFTNMDINNPHLYHLIINNSKSTLDQTADIIIARLKSITID